MSSAIVGKFKVNLAFGYSNRSVLLPENVSFNELVAYVRKKFAIPDTSDISLVYKTRADCIEVKDDEDLEYFVLEVCCRMATLQKLYVNITAEHEASVEVSKPSHPFDLNVPAIASEGDYKSSFWPLWHKSSINDIPDTPPQPEPLIKVSRYAGNGISVGNDFSDKREVIYVIGKKSLKEGFEYVVNKSSPQRYSVKCKQQGCDWSVYTRKVKHGATFIVTKCHDKHTCSRTQIHPNHRNATKKLLGQLLVEKLRNSNRLYKVKDIMHDLSIDWKIDVSYKRSWAGKNHALTLLYGSHEESFDQLAVYCHNLKLMNAGTVTHIQTDEEGRFKMLYVGFGFAVRSFLRYMRPLLIIDAAHLKGQYLGTNLLAVAMDGNNQIVPIATGISQGETNESWTWFLTKLRDQMGEPPNLCIISDRHPALIVGCSTVFRNSYHGYCDRHLMMNCKLRTRKHRSMYWKTCKAYTTQEFDNAIGVLRGYRPDCVAKLEQAGIDKWSRAYCPANRYNYMTSNSVESVNSVTRLARKLPVTKVVEYIRCVLQRWYCEKRETYRDAQEGELSAWAANKVKNRMLKSYNWNVTGIHHLKIYQVTDDKTVHTVDLLRAECTCRKWQLSGLPCGHVCAVCRCSGMSDCNLWAKPWFFRTTLKGTYEEMVNPLKDPSMWEKPGDIQKVTPPLMSKRQPGRPKNKDRVRSKGEAPTIPVCSRCGMRGHHRGNCGQPLPQNEGVTKRKSY